MELIKLVGIQRMGHRGERRGYKLKNGRRIWVHGQPGNAGRRRARRGRDPFRYINLCATSCMHCEVAPKRKVLQGGGCIVAKGDAAEVVQIGAMAE